MSISIKPITSAAALKDWLDHNLRMMAEGDSSKDDLLGPMKVKIVETAALWPMAEQKELETFCLRREKIKQCREDLEKLALYCGDARVAIQRRFIRDTIALSIQEMFELRMGRPTSVTDRKWLRVAVNFLRGNAALLAANLKGLADPTAEEIATLLAKAQKSCKEADEANISHQESAEAFRVVSVEAREVCLDTSAWFRFSLRRQPKSSQRNTMRRFGFSFEDMATGEVLADPEPQQERHEALPVTQALPQQSVS